MNFKAKYVIVRGCAIVFFEGIAHSEMVGHNEKCEGAGFVSFTPYINTWGEERVKATCYGRSVTLNIDSRPEEDSILISSQICNS